MTSTSVYRTRSQALSARLGAVILTVLAIVLSVVVISFGDAWPGLALMALIFIPPVTWLARAGFTGVQVEESGVRIVNIMRTLTIPWCDLERFSVGQRGILPRVGIAHLRNGRQIAIWAIQGPNPLTRPKNRDAERMMDALNAELRARTVSPQSPSQELGA